MSAHATSSASASVFHAPQVDDQPNSPHTEEGDTGQGGKPDGEGPKLTGEAELAALLCSRVCHDLISPVGAVSNGIELMEEMDDAETRDMAIGLIGTSARTATAKLKFARMAYGAGGSMGAQIDLNEAGAVAQEYFSEHRATLQWSAPGITLPKDQVKLLLNLSLTGLDVVPLGGTVTVTLEGDPRSLVVKAAGPKARVPEQIEDLFAGRIPVSELLPRVVHMHYAGVLARALGFTLSVETAEDAQPEGPHLTVTLRAVPKAAAG